VGIQTHTTTGRQQNPLIDFWWVLLKTQKTQWFWLGSVDEALLSIRGIHPIPATKNRATVVLRRNAGHEVKMIKGMLYADGLWMLS
jgi:hypothetical protein